MFNSSEYINDGFATLLNFLLNTKSSGIEFWETTLNFLMNELESNKKGINIMQKDYRSKELSMRELKKDLLNYKRTCGYLETEQTRL